MNYVIKIEAGVPSDYPIQIENFRELHNKESFTIEELDILGYAPFILIDKPKETATLKVTDNGYILGSDFYVRSEYLVEAKLPEEINLVQLEREERNKRNELLTKTDFYALSDVTMTPEVTVYRQELRDITSQANFPVDIIWPTKPV